MHIVTDRDDSEPEVMTSLPRSRPVRRSSKRAERPPGDGAQSTGARGAKAATKGRSRTAAKPKAAAKRGAASNGGGPTRRPPRTTPRPRPAAAAETAPPTATPPATAARGPRGMPVSPAPPVDPPRMEPERKVPAAGYAAPSTRVDESGSPVADLVTTGVLAASELAQIGLDVGRSALRAMIDRLPKP
jgi:hypothetical protein